MARVTVEDCRRKVENRFELIAVASERAKAIGSGAKITVDRDNDKNPVVALREIASGKVDVAKLKESIINSIQTIKTGILTTDTPLSAPKEDEKFSKEAKQEIESLTQNDIDIEDIESGISFEEENLDIDD